MQFLPKNYFVESYNFKLHQNNGNAVYPLKNDKENIDKYKKIYVR